MLRVRTSWGATGSISSIIKYAYLIFRLGGEVSGLQAPKRTSTVETHDEAYFAGAMTIDAVADQDIIAIPVSTHPAQVRSNQRRVEGSLVAWVQALRHGRREMQCRQIIVDGYETGAML